jgi:hypothetical protein
MDRTKAPLKERERAAKMRIPELRMELWQEESGVGLLRRMPREGKVCLVERLL